MKSIASLLAVVVGLCAVSGCKFSSGSVFHGHSGNLPVRTNIVVKGDIPAGLALVDVENRFGTVKVVGSDEPTGSWSWSLTVRAATEEDGQRAAALARCPAERMEDRFQIAVSLPDSRGEWAFSSEIEVRLPRAMAARVENHFGRIEVGGLAGAVQVSGQNGAVELRDIGGAVTASTSFAPMTAVRIGPAVLKNQNGKIDVAEVSGALEASTSFASMTVRNVSGSARLHNQNGSVDLEGAASAEIRTSFAGLSVKEIVGSATLANQNGRIAASKIGGALDAKTSFAPMEISGEGPSFVCWNQNGPIRLDIASGSVSNIAATTSFAAIDVLLPAELKPVIQARTQFAGIESDFPIMMKPKGTDAFADAEKGAPRIRLDTQNGPIRIAKR